MKNIVWLIMVMIALLMSACGDVTTDVEEEAGQDKEQEQTTGKEEKEQPHEENEESAYQETQDEQNQADSAEPVYRIDDETSSVIPIDEKATEKVVLLTVDDVPDKYALEMARTLEKLDAKAIFFVNGHFLDTSERQDALQQIHEMGFEIGNHTNSHSYLPDLPEDEQKEEIVSLNDTVEDIIGERPQFFRAPNGANTDFTRQLAEDEDMVLMNWTYGYDYFEPYMDAEKLTEAMVTGKAPEVDVPHSLLKPGANLLMHDREWTAAALEDIFSGLRDKGYKIVDPDAIQTRE
ncbi:polysaccharide deacetylase family protein [Lentibacillus salinarum]|uniref:Polysaccharide deacetylase family protein n=1 Tax=Lentibacillus salinarum TaxID=446820 RepID=A0ABW3ZPK8_9BACI